MANETPEQQADRIRTTIEQAIRAVQEQGMRVEPGRTGVHCGAGEWVVSPGDRCCPMGALVLSCGLRPTWQTDMGLSEWLGVPEQWIYDFTDGFDYPESHAKGSDGARMGQSFRASLGFADE